MGLSSDSGSSRIWRIAHMRSDCAIALVPAFSLASNERERERERCLFIHINIATGTYRT